MVRSLLLLMSLALATGLGAQTPSDALMMEGGQACVLLQYSQGSFDQYWEGSLKRENQTIATVQRSTFLPMTAIGLTNRLNFFVGLPHVSTESSKPNGGRFAGVSGWQDLTLALKYQWLKRQTDRGELAGLATVGFSTPATNYLPDYMPYALGLGAPELSYRAILQYRFTNGPYLRGAAAYLWRGYSEAERTYYYNNGSYYTAWMDVPNAVTFEAVVGTWLLDNSLQLELNYLGSRSTSGDDIRAYNAAQPTNNIDIDRVGALAHYYLPWVPGLGLVAFHQRVINGRNTAAIHTTGLGVTYFFHFLKK
ncbi:MAG: transporter [Lewinella sp.]|nr:transporter [Lewinella sp.]